MWAWNHGLRTLGESELEASGGVSPVSESGIAPGDANLNSKHWTQIHDMAGTLE